MTDTNTDTITDTNTDAALDGADIPAPSPATDTGAIQAKPRKRRDVTRKGDTRRFREDGMMSDRLGRTLARLGLEPEPRSSSPLVGVTVTTSIVNADGTPFERDPHEPITHIQHVIVTPAYAESAVIEQPQLAAALPHVPPPPERIVEPVKPVVPIAQPWSGKSTTAQFYEAGGGDYWHTPRIVDWSDRSRS